MKHFFFILVFCVSASAVNAQTKAQTAPAFKIAYFDRDSLLNIMPEFKAATDSAQAYYNKLETQLAAMIIEFQELSNAFDNYHGESQAKREQSVKEMADLQANIQAFQESAQEEYKTYKEKLLVPVFAKVNVAAKKVANEKGYAYVLDSGKSQGIVIFANESYNIFDDMCKELGIPVPKK